MDVRFSRFEILTGTGALFLCLAFVCVFVEAGAIENDIGIGAVGAIADDGLLWSAVEPSGQHLVLTGAAADELPRQRAGEAAQAVPGVAGVTNRIQVVGAAESCQRQVDEHLRHHPVAFKAGRVDVTESSLQGLSAAAAIVERCGGRFEIAGHTDAGGDAAINLQLSQRRAEAVVRHLVQSGADPGRLTAVGYGKRQPVADNRSAAGRSANQRLEIRLMGVDA